MTTASIHIRPARAAGERLNTPAREQLMRHAELVADPADDETDHVVDRLVEELGLEGPGQSPLTPDGCGIVT